MLRHRHLVGRWAERYTYSYIFIFNKIYKIFWKFVFFLFFVLIMKLKITTADFIMNHVPDKQLHCVLVYGSRFPQQSVGRRFYFNIGSRIWLKISWGEKFHFVFKLYFFFNANHSNTKIKIFKNSLLIELTCSIWKK